MTIEEKYQKKWRYPNWWFGRYIQWMGSRWIDEEGKTFPSSQVELAAMEPYQEHKHGIRNEEKRRFHPDQFTPGEKQEMVYLLTIGRSMWEVATKFKTSEKAIRSILRDAGQSMVRHQAVKEGKNGTST